MCTGAAPTASPSSAVLAPTEDELQAVLRKIITRPALANERVQTNSAGQVVLKLKNPWCDGTA